MKLATFIVASLASVLLMVGCVSDAPMVEAATGVQPGSHNSYRDYQITFAYQRRDTEHRHQVISSDICIVNYDGSGFTNLTKGAVSGVYPRWSPDRKQILFLSPAPKPDKKTKWHYYLVNSDGTGLKQIEDHYVWSPTGDRIAFSSTTKGNQDIYVMNADGTSLTRLTDHPKDDRGPRWSPDGKRIVFTSRRNGPTDIYAINADGSDLTLLTGRRIGLFESWDDSPFWSATGNKIVYKSNSSICSMNADGTGKRTLVRNATSYSVSPDGKHIAYLRSVKRKGIYPSFRYDLCVMAANGRHKRTLLDNVRIQSFSRGQDAWSPDSKWIAVHLSKKGLARISPDGTGFAVIQVDDLPGRVATTPSW